MKIKLGQLRKLVREAVQLNENYEWDAAIEFPNGEVEIVTVHAPSFNRAKDAVKLKLDLDYKPGGKIIDLRHASMIYISSHK